MLGLARCARLGLIGLILLLTACLPQAESGDQGSYGLFPDFGLEAVERRPSDACFSEAERRSDVLARLRTQLMVTSLTCSDWLQRENLYAVFSDFTLVNADLIRTAQSDVGRVLGRSLSGSNARLYDTYITALANDEFLLVTQIGAEQYCIARSTAFDAAMAADEAGIEAYIDEALVLLAPSYPDC